MSDYRDRVKRAMFKHHEKIHKENNKTKRKHTKTEKIEVEKPCVNWMKNQGWEVENSKAEAKYNSRIGKYIKTDLQSGMTDTRGWDSNDRPFYVEFKSPGKRSNVYGSPSKGNLNRQSDFILKQIRRGCFSVVVDSKEMLIEYWLKWTFFMDNDEKDQAKDFLIKMMPKEPKRRKSESSHIF